MNPEENNKEVLPIIENALKVRDWEKNNLPIEQSALALDLFLVISYNTLKGKPLTLKLLFHSIDFSEAGIRKHLKRLLVDGWCSLEGTEHDKRLRHVVAQPKMLSALTDYTEVLKDAFGTATQTL
jgi:hypothetical protein